MYISPRANDEVPVTNFSNFLLVSWRRHSWACTGAYSPTSLGLQYVTIHSLAKRPEQSLSNKKHSDCCTRPQACRWHEAALYDDQAWGRNAATIHPVELKMIKALCTQHLEAISCVWIYRFATKDATTKTQKSVQRLDRSEPLATSRDAQIKRS